ncbi:hypothetical protein O3M35_009794 [Rhynocoris fuscipes]|uniref:Sodium/potassium-transporting ATPase subunit beta-1-interacting protein n=1 Tax=Rhynocoris fuscipes TaxID=488301 RepID=A0AAW1D4Z5_9HEMI
MGCNKRLFLLSICVSQFVTAIWRQIFDFLGFMWGPILVNFFHIIFVIFGFFGAWQYKSSYILCYAVWSLFWCAWNTFIFCFYLNIGTLNRDWDLLSLGAGSTSWWETNGPGCKPLFLSNHSGIETAPWQPLRPDIVAGCVISYYKLEASQAAIHFILAIIGFLLSISVNSSIKNGEEAIIYDMLPVPSTLKKTTTAPLYPVDLMPRRNIADTNQSLESIDDNNDARQSACRPMTPRRVKRRSVTRGGGGAGALPPPYHTQVGIGSIPRRHGHHRSSTRSSGRRPRPNPVTRILDHEQSGSSGGHTNLMFQHSPENSFVYEPPERPPSVRSSYSNYHGTRPHSYTQNFLVSGPPGYSSQSETAI